MGWLYAVTLLFDTAMPEIKIDIAGINTFGAGHQFHGMTGATADLYFFRTAGYKLLPVFDFRSQRIRIF